jgi:hypothetical protein
LELKSTRRQPVELEEQNGWKNVGTPPTTLAIRLALSPANPPMSL